MLIVDAIRPAFHDVRAIIPEYAMSAAAMWACASNCLLMGKQSFLGPTDPQMKSDLTGTLASVSDILADYELISRDSQYSGSPLALGFMIARYEPGLINKCKKVKELARIFVEDSLSEYMFKNNHDAAAIAKINAFWLCEEQQLHERYIPRQSLLERGFPVEALEDNPRGEHEVMCVYYSASICMSILPSITKIIANHIGEKYMTIV